MKAFGYVVLVVGVIWLLVAFNLDTSVTTGYGTRVNNIGLMASKQNHIVIGAFITLCGLLMVIFGKRTQPQAVDTTKCPFCAELINPEAIKCKHCGSDVSEHMASLQSASFSLRDVDHTTLLVRSDNSVSLDDGVVKTLAEKMKRQSKSVYPSHIFAEYQGDVTYVKYLLPSALQDDFVKRLKYWISRG